MLHLTTKTIKAVGRIFSKQSILLALVFCAANDSAVQKYQLVEPTAVMQNTQINESSGLASSTLNGETILWTHNDSGDQPRIFALKPDGTNLAEIKITGARSIDWEDMASFTLSGSKTNPKLKQSFFVLADTGANNHNNKDFQLYLIRQPKLTTNSPDKNTPGQLKAKVIATIQLTWPEDARSDCEAVAVDTFDKKIYLAQKKFQMQFDLYTIDLPDFLFEHSESIQTIPQQNIQSIPQKYCTVKNISCITAMDISPDNSRMIFLNYNSAYEFTRQKNQSWKDALTSTGSQPTKIKLPPIKQSEAICYDPTGKKIFITTEKLPTHIFEFLIHCTETESR